MRSLSKYRQSLICVENDACWRPMKSNMYLKNSINVTTISIYVVFVTYMEIWVAISLWRKTETTSIEYFLYLMCRSWDRSNVNRECNTSVLLYIAPPTEFIGQIKYKHFLRYVLGRRKIGTSGPWENVFWLIFYYFNFQVKIT